MTGDARSRSTLRRLPAILARLWLVRSNRHEARAPDCLVLLDALPIPVDPFGAEVARHG